MRRRTRRGRWRRRRRSGGVSSSIVSMTASALIHGTFTVKILVRDDDIGSEVAHFSASARKDPFVHRQLEMEMVSVLGVPVRRQDDLELLSRGGARDVPELVRYLLIGRARER